MKRIVCEAVFIYIVIFPLLSLKKAPGFVRSRELTKMQNTVLRKEIDSLTFQIKVVDEQNKYKDSIDMLPSFVDTTIQLLQRQDGK